MNYYYGRLTFVTHTQRIHSHYSQFYVLLLIDEVNLALFAVSVLFYISHNNLSHHFGFIFLPFPSLFQDGVRP